MTPKIETRLVADLIPYAANSRTHSDAQVAQIAASKAFLMELDPKYCDVIIKRWQDFAGKQAIHAETGVSFDAINTKQDIKKSLYDAAEDE